ncbi:MAG: hypothetical protein M1839_008534 [Geoglossum umbratile]|nr:MAG: hypothetical protein M1839_008534 [Geoglossum umbratile]
MRRTLALLGMDNAETVLPSRRKTGTHTPRQLQLGTRYVTVGGRLGSGAYGTVHKAIGVDLGKFMAVKILERPTRASKQEDWRISLHYALKREVETLSEISRPHIVDYIGSQGWDKPKAEIFMGLKEGTLESLIESGSVPPLPTPSSIRCFKRLIALHGSASFIEM